MSLTLETAYNTGERGFHLRSHFMDESRARAGYCMFELPLFPLNTVLFPGMPINLHIFEERYKQMMSMCIEKRQPFGVVLIKQGREAMGPLARPHAVGCTAHITRVQPLREGQMNILALGHERFRILSIQPGDTPYLVGMVELFPLSDSNTQAVAKGAARLRPMVDRYLQILKDAGQIQYDERHLPADAQTLAYLAAVLLQVPPSQKQPLLACERMSVMLNDLCTIYRRELALLNTMRTWSEDDSRKGPFSLN